MPELCSRRSATPRGTLKQCLHLPIRLACGAGAVVMGRGRGDGEGSSDEAREVMGALVW